MVIILFKYQPLRIIGGKTKSWNPWDIVTQHKKTKINLMSLSHLKELKISCIVDAQLATEDICFSVDEQHVSSKN